MGRQLVEVFSLDDFSDNLSYCCHPKLSSPSYVAGGFISYYPDKEWGLEGN